ncbi:golgin subfamily A member 6-like protein 22 isoform X4 [Tachysurus ichikawai]
MAKFISLFKETVADLSLRPLLLAAGVAATAAVIHYYFNRDDGDKTAADAEDKTVLEDPSYDRTTEPALVRPTEVVQDQMIEPEMKIQKLAVSNHQLENRTREKKDIATELENRVREQEDRARELEDSVRELVDTTIELEDSVRELVDTTIELEDREKELEDRVRQLEDRVRELEDRARDKGDRARQLEDRERELDDRARDQEDTVIEMEDRARQVEDRARELEDREIELEDRLREQENRARELEDREIELEDREIELEDRLREQENRVRELENRERELEEREIELEDRVRDQEDTAIELEDTAIELENRERELEDRERELEDRARELEDRGTERESWRTERESWRNYSFSLADDEERHQKVIQTITELMEEKNNLEHQVETLTHMVEDSEKKIYDTCLQWRKRENGSLAQAEERHQKTVENISQLEKEKCKLRKQVTTMRDTVTDLGYKLYEAHLHRDKLINRRETERQAHRILQVENDELKTALMHKEELLKVSLSEAEEKHQKAVENIIQLEEEKSDMTNQVETLRDTIQDICKPGKSSGTKETTNTETESSLNRSGSSSESV